MLLMAVSMFKSNVGNGLAKKELPQARHEGYAATAVGPIYGLDGRNVIFLLPAPRRWLMGSASLSLFDNGDVARDMSE